MNLTQEEFDRLPLEVRIRHKFSGRSWWNNWVDVAERADAEEFWTPEEIAASTLYDGEYTRPMSDLETLEQLFEDPVARWRKTLERARAKGDTREVRRLEALFQALEEYRAMLHSARI